MSQHPNPHQAPPADRRLQVVAGVVLLLPMLALVPVGWYAKTDPKLGSFPFFIWYQMALVFFCAICTSIAYALVKKARPHVPFEPVGKHAAHRDGE
ncbi:DUF3311 domain-containing protein [Flexivirga meconopsidis]|uniref:DUF3311 domain-containing protein n=1 Tax=Flexivirga meconopsidis TaxID=2977121 RepID=UPI00223FE67D|nr:DUF3311 domain-containing protein [Flexivirga meconopsidis]